MDKLSVLLVDASVLTRKNMTDLINSTEYGMVVRNASNAQIALEWLEQIAFDVILLDVNILIGNGSRTVSSFKKAYPNIEIIIVSDSTPKSAELTLDAMNLGAMDFVLHDEPGVGVNHLLSEQKLRQSLEAIFTQIKVAQYLKRPEERISSVTKKEYSAEVAIKSPKKTFYGDFDLVVIASSTGGPAALETVLQNLPVDYKKPTLIVQHMPPEFTRVLAESLHKKYNINIREGMTGDVICENEILIAPGGFHMVVEEAPGNKAQIKILDTPFYNGLKPAADLLLKSIAKVYSHRNILCVVLTGMGNDGTEGIKELKKSANVYSMTQSEPTCVVYGMPKCIVDAGLSDEVVDLKDIAFRIYQLSNKRGEF